MDARGFHDELADHYDLTYAPRDAGATRRGRALDMRALPFADASFDALARAGGALPHRLTAEGVRAALAETRRALRPGGLRTPRGPPPGPRPRRRRPDVREAGSGESVRHLPATTGSHRPVRGPGGRRRVPARRNDASARPTLDALNTPRPPARP
ncbi:class I SAM-dependent methyltransferase [Streptomyces sp. NPDC001568]|uniref:class I SAM-dependent methyltransferase n=1 Tax=Streptomyces sp. NPDC001568 TaxID=3364588 RepID=UPI0036A8C883